MGEDMQAIRRVCRQWIEIGIGDFEHVHLHWSGGGWDQHTGYAAGRRVASQQDLELRRLADGARCPGRWWTGTDETAGR